MDPEQAKARARALLNVIETMYELKIVNRERVIEAVIGKTCDDNKILTICTALNSWVAMNATRTREVEIPVAVVNELVRNILNV
jgi:hypothetical protein